VPFVTGSVLAFVRGGHLRPEFAQDVSDDIAQAVRLTESDFRTPRETVERYLGFLVDRGLLLRDWIGWSPVESEAKRFRGVEDGPKRVGNVRRRVASLCAKLGPRDLVDHVTWMDTVHSGLAASPRSLALAGGAPYWQLDEHLARLDKMIEPGAEVEEDLLSLPLAAVRDARRAEKAQREAESCARAERAESEMTEREERANAQALREAATSLLGTDDGEAWLVSLGISTEDARMTEREFLDAHERLSAELARLGSRRPHRT
jgi:hypothetical protein